MISFVGLSKKDDLDLESFHSNKSRFSICPEEVRSPVVVLHGVFGHFLVLRRGRSFEREGE